ncbi:MAG: type II toxin-antitoxin system RelE family toxin [Candidatus Woesearchaeota archaeon]
MYKLIFDKNFKKDIDKLDGSVKSRILSKVFELEYFPELGKHLLGVDLWSLRIGKFRVLYKIKGKELEILVLTLEHRKKVYRDFN